jgi:hypothetical protein
MLRTVGVQGHQLGFIPKRLEVPGKPEYSHFPVNVLFASFRRVDGRLQSGSAIYEPDFDAYRQEGHICSMTYRNVYRDKCFLQIEYDHESKQYRGKKFINGQAARSAFGKDNWRSFFVHFTMLGLEDGEGCTFEMGSREI